MQSLGQQLRLGNSASKGKKHLSLLQDRKGLTECACLVRHEGAVWILHDGRKRACRQRRWALSE